MAVDPKQLDLSVRVRVKILDRGWDKLNREVRKLARAPFVKVGFPEESADTTAPHKESAGQTVLGIALVHEFGTTKAGRNRQVTIPQRSFIRSTFDDKNRRWQAQISAFIGQISIGRMTVERALDRIGLIAVDDIKEKVASNIPPELSEVTKKLRKNKTEPFIALMDTNQMVNSITFVRKD